LNPVRWDNNYRLCKQRRDGLNECLANTYRTEPVYISTRQSRQITCTILVQPNCFREPMYSQHRSLMHVLQQTHLGPEESQDNGHDSDLPGQTSGSIDYSLAAISCQAPVLDPIFPEFWPVQDRKLRICLSQRSGALHAPRLLRMDHRCPWGARERRGRTKIPSRVIIINADAFGLLSCFLSFSPPHPI
jgi:hypothetical protein